MVKIISTTAIHNSLQAKHASQQNEDDDLNSDFSNIENNSDFDALDVPEGELVQENNIDLKDELKSKYLSLKNTFDNKYTNKSNQSSNLWLERMTVISNNHVDPSLNLNDDIKRELIFYNLSIENAIQGINKLRENGQKINRPDDFLAEMLKTDKQMQNVKKDIISNQDRIKKFQLREQKMLNKKFNKKMKSKSNKEDMEYKRRSKEALESWKSDIKTDPSSYQRLDEYLNRSNTSKKIKGNRDKRDKKYNPKLAHQEKIKENSRKGRRLERHSTGRNGSDFNRGGFKGRGGDRGDNDSGFRGGDASKGSGKGGSKGSGFGLFKRSENFDRKKSGFNQQNRPKQSSSNNKRPGKNARMNHKNKTNSKK